MANKPVRYLYFPIFSIFNDMKAVIQRVSSASVTIGSEAHRPIGRGLLIYLGIGGDDTRENADWLVKKIFSLRIFGDESGLMNLSMEDIRGEFLVISQFTLHAKTRKGTRPSFSRAAPPEEAVPLYEHFLKALALVSGLPVKAGEFGAHMQVASVNDGPVTILIDTKQKE